MTNRRWAVAGLAVVALGVIAWIAFGRGDGAKGKPAPAGGRAAPTVLAKGAADDPAAEAREARASLRLGRDADPDGPLLLEGQVLDEHDDPVAGAEVWLSSAPERTTTTDTDGSFAFDKLLGRTYAVGARAGDLVGGPVPIKLTAQPEPVVIRLRPGAQVTVRVRDAAADKPIASATVTLLEIASPTATTDAQGVATFRGVGDGRIAVRATAPGYGPGVATGMVGKSQRALELTISMTTGAPVSGIVVDEKGAPIAGARVWAGDASAAWDASRGDREPVPSDAKGEFRIPALSAGSYRISAIDEVHAPAQSQLVTVDGMTPTTGVRLVMPAGAVLAGKVVDAAGQPAPYATIKVSSPEWANDMVNRQAAADDRGAFRIDGLPRRALKVRAEAETASSALAAIDLAAGDRRDLTLVLDQTATIAGIVVDKAGAPVAEASVSAVPDFLADDAGDFDFILASATAATTDGGGRFVLRGLEEGAYRIAASRGGHDDRTAWGADSVAVRTGTTDARLVLPNPGGIRGTIVLAGGGAPDLAMIAAGWEHRTTTRDGRFELTGMRPGKVDLRVTGPDFAERARADVEVLDGEITDVGTIEVTAGRKAAGRVTDAKGAPVAGAKVMIDKMIFGDGKSSAADLDDGTNRLSLRTATTGDDGRFTIRGISRDGGVIIAEHDKHGRSIALPVPRGAEDVTNLAIKLRGFGSLTGTVTRKGEPVAGAAVSAAPAGASGQAVFVTTGADGKFVIDKLPEGTTAVTAIKQVVMSSTSHARNVEVIAGQVTDASIDMPAGDVSLTIRIEPRPGDTVNAAFLLLMRGGFVARTAQALMDAYLSAQGGSSGGAAGTNVWLGTPTFPAFLDLLPGAYSICAMPITGNLMDPQLNERINANLDKLDAVCKAVTVTATPKEQTFTLVLPAMKPLPAPGTEAP